MCAFTRPLLLALLVCALWAPMDAAEDRPASVLTGRVLRPGNKPASGAAVTLLFYDDDSRQHQRHTVADASGAFHFELTSEDAGQRVTFQCLAQQSGAGAGWTDCPEGDKSVDVHLTSPVEMAVCITDAGGKPISGLDLRVAMFNRVEPPGPAVALPPMEGAGLNGRTDANGRCTFENLPAGAQLMLAHSDEQFAQFGFGSWIQLGGGPKVDAGALTLTAAATISGTVRYEGTEGRPAADVHVHAQPPVGTGAGNADARTDAHGRFTFRQMAPGPYGLTCYLFGLASDWVAVPRTSVVAAGQTVADQDITLSHGALITGTITSAATGKGISGVGIGAEPQPDAFPGQELSTESGADGKYSLRVVPGTQHVYLSRELPEGYSVPRSSEKDLEIKEHGISTLDFALPETAATDFVSGCVLDDHNQPAAGAEIFLCTPGEWIFVTPRKADSHGNFRLRVAAVSHRSGQAVQKRVKLFARTDPGLMTANGVDADAGANGIVIHLTRDASAQVSGRITDTGGKPLAEVPVRANINLGSMPGDNRVVRTDAQGGFTFEALWPGLEYSFVSESTEYTFGHAGGLALTPGERRLLPDWRLEPARLSIAGKVVDAAGKSVAGATIFPNSGRTGARPATSGSDGTFRIEGLAEEWLTLEVNARTATATDARIKAGDQNVLVELHAPGTTGTGPEDRVENFAAFINHPAPILQTGEWINAPPVDEAQRRGKVTVISFWSVTCGACIRSMPEEQKFWEENRERGLMLIGLHNSGPVLEVREFLEKQSLKVSYPLAMDARGGATGSAYGAVALPTYSVIDREGRVAYLDHDWTGARQKAAELLEKRP